MLELEARPVATVRHYSNLINFLWANVLVFFLYLASAYKLVRLVDQH